MRAEAHAQLARQMLPTEWCDSVDALMQRDGQHAGVLFHRRQLWLTLQLAILTCKHSDTPVTEQDVPKAMGRAAFMASDLLEDIEDICRPDFSDLSMNESVIATIVPLLNSSCNRVDFDIVGRARLLWIDLLSSAEMQEKLKKRGIKLSIDAFTDRYGISLEDFLRIMVALYVRLVGNQCDTTANPVLFDLREDPIGEAFSLESCDKVTALVSQTLDALAIQLLLPRQSWAVDFTPLRERPLIEALPGKLCCPDITSFLRAFVDRVYFLLEDAIGKDAFRNAMGIVFEEYVNRMMEECTAASGITRTYLRSPRFENSQDEACDAVVFWGTSAAVIECKASILTNRQRLAGIPSEVIRGIQTLALGLPEQKQKGISQLASNLDRMLKSGNTLNRDGITFNLERCDRLFPILALYEEDICFHAVQRWLQPKLENALIELGTPLDRIAPLMIFSIRDIEELSKAGQKVSINEILAEYANHLRAETSDIAGTFSGFVRIRYPVMHDPSESLTFRKHKEAIEELIPLMGEKS